MDFPNPNRLFIRIDSFQFFEFIVLIKLIYKNSIEDLHSQILITSYIKNLRLMFTYFICNAFNHYCVLEYGNENYRLSCIIWFNLKNLKEKKLKCISKYKCCFSHTWNKIKIKIAEQKPAWKLNLFFFCNVWFTWCYITLYWCRLQWRTYLYIIEILLLWISGFCFVNNKNQ